MAHGRAFDGIRADFGARNERRARRNNDRSSYTDRDSGRHSCKTQRPDWRRGRPGARSDARMAHRDRGAPRGERTSLVPHTQRVPRSRSSAECLRAIWDRDRRALQGLDTAVSPAQRRTRWPTSARVARAQAAVLDAPKYATSARRSRTRRNRPRSGDRGTHAGVDRRAARRREPVQMRAGARRRARGGRGSDPCNLGLGLQSTMFAPVGRREARVRSHACCGRARDTRGALATAPRGDARRATEARERHRFPSRATPLARGEPVGFTAFVPHSGGADSVPLRRAAIGARARKDLDHRRRSRRWQRPDREPPGRMPCAGDAGIRQAHVRANERPFDRLRGCAAHNATAPASCARHGRRSQCARRAANRARRIVARRSHERRGASEPSACDSRARRRRRDPRLVHDCDAPNGDRQQRTAIRDPSPVVGETRRVRDRGRTSTQVPGVGRAKARGYCGHGRTRRTRSDGDRRPLPRRSESQRDPRRLRTRTRDGICELRRRIPRRRERCIERDDPRRSRRERER
ncbi:unnamed protein product [Wuchereria bancrofti]|uniref:Uncharacterized protein n=1 Tax=Wuchereria bancrofti TaxID=6293 RepID=A0A3P7E5K4_WUCBA|nr:unnamed protein product [Wuchereria bancrofti]